jgi:phosphopantetheinyl transferase
VAIFFQHSINDNTKLGIWKIEEQENFFLQKVPLRKNVSHPYKRLQHLAGRYLLPLLFEDFPLEEIKVADTRKPFLHDEKYHFSISHCGNYAAALASSENRVGVDIEIVTPTVGKIAAKFLHEEEKKILDEWKALPNLYLQLLTVMWSAKEAVYKWYGDGQVDFSEHIRLQGTKLAIKPNETAKLSFQFVKHNPVDLSIEVKIFGNLVLAWVVS